MRIYINIFVFVAFGFFANLETAQADCAVTGATGSGGEVVMCTGTDTDGYDGTIFVDNLTIPAGAVVGRATGDTINLSDGNDVVLISGGTVTSASDPIETDNGDDYVTMTSGSLIGDSDGIRLNNGDDTIIITGGVITGNADDGVEGDAGNDSIIISNAIITGSDAAIEADSGDDLVEIGDNTTINGMMDGGSDVDILRFSMTVPSADLAALQSALSAANPASDSIMINGESYNWVNFESIESNLRGSVPTSVPSLQLWGIIILFGMILLATQQTFRKPYKF